MTSAELLQAGVDATQGRPFKLPVMQAAPRNEHPDASTTWPAVEAWHLACHSAIRAGVGQDRQIQLLTDMGKLFGRVLQLPATVDETARQRVLDDFEKRLAARIKVLRQLNKERSFVISQHIEYADDPRVLELHKEAERLNSLAVAYSGHPGEFVRGDEFELLESINFALQAINNIPA